MWRETDEAGIDAVVAVGRLTEDHGSVTGEELAGLQRMHPNCLYGFAR